MAGELLVVGKDSLYDQFINTEAFLETSLGEELEPLEHWQALLEDKWLMQVEGHLLGLITSHQFGSSDRPLSYTCSQVYNTYNQENDLSSNFQYQVFYPVDSTSGCHYYCQDTYIAVECHLGGDVRGNYGRVRLYGPIDNLAETGFFDLVHGWFVTDVHGSNLDWITERASVGYASNPTSELESHLDAGCEPKFLPEKEGFLVQVDGEDALAFPEYYINGI